MALCCFASTQKATAQAKGDTLVGVFDADQHPSADYDTRKFIEKNQRYPEAAKAKGITGAVPVDFIIDVQGVVRNVHVSKAFPDRPMLGYGLEEEAIRVVKAMPRWLPGKRYGVTVPVLMRLAIRFPNVPPGGAK